MSTVESEARRSIHRLRRSLEKSRRELAAVVGAIRHAQGDDFPATAYAAAEDHISALMSFVDEESSRLEDQILQSGGLEPGRVRRGSR